MTKWTFYDIESCPVCGQGPYQSVPTPSSGKPAFWQTCCLGCGTRGGKSRTRTGAIELWNEVTKLKLELSFNPAHLRRMQDCIILIKWRSSICLEEHEQARLTALVNNFQLGEHSIENLCVKQHWDQ